MAHGCSDLHRPIGWKEELGQHLPYTLFAAIASLLALGVLSRTGSMETRRELFHLLHPIHLLLSAMATTAMFWIHDHRAGKAVGLGILGAVGACGLSDVILPFLAGRWLGASMQLHFCLWNEPCLAVPFLAVGLAAGLMAGQKIHGSTFYSHAGHVLVSSLATLLYLTGFGLQSWLPQAGWILVILVIAVLIPCCFSDIVFPLLFVQAAPEGDGSSVGLPPSAGEEVR